MYPNYLHELRLDSLTTKEKAIALTASFAGAAVIMTALLVTVQRDEARKEAFYKNKPVQTGWPVCKKTQVEWKHSCVPK